MSRIGIVTYHFVPNYGAAMQAWALQQSLEQLGHEVFFVDYRPSHLTTGGAYKLPLSAWSRRANVVITYLKVMALKKAVLGDGGKGAIFERFLQDYLKLGDRCYKTNHELKAQPPEADAFVCGSDQIWNASEQFGVDSSYFLDFVPAGIKRISYAASFGRPYVVARHREETARFLRHIDHVSVREESGVNLVTELSGKTAKWVPDPTLLVNDGFHEAIAPGNAGGDFVFSYTLRSRELVADIESAVSKRLGCPIVSPSSLAAEKRGAPSPLEWLGYFKAAKFVITNSYHGTLFSIIFRKPFVFVGLAGPKSGFNERAFSLLTRLRLEERLISEESAGGVVDVLTRQIDWNRVESEIQMWRADALDFLEYTLNRGF